MSFNTLSYTITKFDSDLKLLDVAFDDGTWAQVRLQVPLPKTIEEVEQLIKHFAAPVEVMEARGNPDVDLSYIDQHVGVQRVCTRMKLTPEDPTKDGLSEEQLAAMEAEEKASFQESVKEALIALGVQVPNV